MVCREWRAAVAAAMTFAMFDSRILAIAAGRNHTVILTTAGVQTCGHGDQIGHGKASKEQLRPRLVKTLCRHPIVGVAAGFDHTAFWTDAGDI